MYTFDRSRYKSAVFAELSGIGCGLVGMLSLRDILGQGNYELNWILITLGAIWAVLGTGLRIGKLFNIFQLANSYPNLQTTILAANFLSLLLGSICTLLLLFSDFIFTVEYPVLAWLVMVWLLQWIGLDIIALEYWKRAPAV